MRKKHMFNAIQNPPLATSNSQLATSPPAGVSWIDIATAAGRSGWTERNIRRLCGERWLADGLAQLRKSDSGQSAWFVREDADPKFARIKFPEQLTKEFDIRVLSDAHRNQVLSRKKILDDWHSAMAGGMQLGMSRTQSTATFLARLQAEGACPTPSRSTLHNWQRFFRRDGLAGLLDDRRERAAHKVSGNDPFFSFLEKLYLTPKQFKLALCHSMAEQKAVESGWEIRNYKACQRYIASLDPALVTKKREGEKAFVDKHEPNIRRDYSTLNTNDLWCSDHYRFDVMVRDPRDPKKTIRPWLTSWQDVRSRKILGWRVYAGDPNTDTILASFTDAALEFGIPQRVYVDNGKDYAGKTFHGVTAKERRAAGRSWRDLLAADRPRIDGVYNLLQIDVMHAWPYHGQSKPIERFHNTLADRFCRQFDTYCGRDTLHKPENLQDQIAKGHAPTLKEFTDAFCGWLVTDYHARVHTGDAMDKMTPDQAFAAHLQARRTTTADLLKFACMPRVGPFTVGQDGISYKGIQFGGFDRAVQDLFGKSVLLAIDNSDLSQVLVLDIDGRLICQAKANRKIAWNVSAKDLGDVIKEKKQLRKRMKEYNDARPRMSMAGDTQSLLERAALRKAAETAAADGQIDLPPVPSSPVQTGYEDQMHQIEAALNKQPMRLAVGYDPAVAIPDISESASHMRISGTGPFSSGGLSHSSDEPVDMFDRISSAMDGTEVQP
jgi:putative transposase